MSSGYNFHDIRSRSSYNEVTYSALIPTIEPETKLILMHNKNIELFSPKDDNLQAWHKYHIIPWGALFDLFIVLLFIFFALTYQSSKIRFCIKFQSIFDSFFLGDTDDDDDGLTLLFFKQDVLDAANSSAYRFFDFAERFPSQDQFEQNSDLDVHVVAKNNTVYDELVTNDTIDRVYEIFESFKENLLYGKMQMSYLLTRTSKDSVYLTEIFYTISFEEKTGLGIIEWKSDFIGKDRATKGSNKFSNQLSVNIYPIAIIIADSIAILLTVNRFYMFFKHSKEYAKKNYISLSKALLWKINFGEIFNLFYQVFTLIAVILYMKLIDDDFNGHKMLVLIPSIAGFLHCLGLFRHLKMKKETWFVARLVFKSISRTLLIVCGFLPFYFGFVFMGIANFGYFSYLFNGFLRTMKILFSMMHTDVCMDTQEAIKDESVSPQWLVLAYCGTWLLLTGGMVINIFIAIVESTLAELMVEDND